MTATGIDEAILLIDTLETEARLLSELVAVFRQQRTALTADNEKGVGDSMFAGHRILETLREAQRRQSSLLELLTGDPAASLAALDDVVSNGQAKAVAALRRRIGKLAAELARELGLTRRALLAPMGLAQEE